MIEEPLFALFKLLPDIYQWFESTQFFNLIPKSLQIIFVSKYWKKESLTYFIPQRLFKDKTTMIPHCIRLGIEIRHLQEKGLSISCQCSISIHPENNRNYLVFRCQSQLYRHVTWCSDLKWEPFYFSVNSLFFI